jgi:hypothetical protein
MNTGILGLSDGTLDGAPIQGLQSPWYTKDRFDPEFRTRIGSLGLSWKLKLLKPFNCSIWLKHGQNGVKPPKKHFPEQYTLFKFLLGKGGELSYSLCNYSIK